MEQQPQPPPGEDQAAPPQYSPDGRFWWDGAHWTPVEQLPRLDQPWENQGDAGWEDEEDRATRSLSRVGLLLVGSGAVLLIGWAVFAFHLIGL
ncbi:MAG: hypothetical protein ACREN8_00875 [Candidatus Dormibacteraceae bacterium]